MSARTSDAPVGGKRRGTDGPGASHQLQQIGGYAAVMQTVLYLVAMVFILVIWPRYGIRGPADAMNPALVLPALHRAPILIVFAVLDVPIAVCLLLIVLALADRLHAVSPVVMRTAMTSGIVSVACFLALGMIRFLGWSQLAGLHVQEAARAEAAYAAVSAIDSGLDGAALFSLAWWVLLTSWADAHAGTLPKGLRYLGVLLGVVGVISAVAPPLRPIALIVVLLWTPWIGFVLAQR